MGCPPPLAKIPDGQDNPTTIARIRLIHTFNRQRTTLPKHTENTYRGIETIKSALFEISPKTPRIDCSMSNFRFFLKFFTLDPATIYIVHPRHFPYLFQQGGLGIYNNHYRGFVEFTSGQAMAAQAAIVAKLPITPPGSI